MRRARLDGFGREPRAAEIHALPARGNTLAAKTPKLLGALRDAPVGTHDAVPWDVLIVQAGERRRFGPGDVVLVEDTSGRGHITRWLGDGPRRTLFLPLPDCGAQP